MEIPSLIFCRRTTGWHTGLRHTRFGRNPRKAAQGILSALRTGRANPTSWKCRNSSLWSFGRWSAGTGIFSNGTSGTGSLTRYGTKPFTDGRCVCLRALMNAWLRKNGMKRSIRRLGAFQRYKGGVSCSTTSMIRRYLNCREPTSRWGGCCQKYRPKCWKNCRKIIEAERKKGRYVNEETGF